MDEKCFGLINLYYKNSKTMDLSKYDENACIILNDSKIKFEDLYISKDKAYKQRY